MFNPINRNYQNPQAPDFKRRVQPGAQMGFQQGPQDQSQLFGQFMQRRQQQAQQGQQAVQPGGMPQTSSGPQAAPQNPGMGAPQQQAAPPSGPQAFIQAAIQQGHDPQMVMNFLKSKMGGQNAQF